jgi:FkbM family methyltransferase
MRWLFALFTASYRLLRGSGLGNIALLRRVRDTLFEWLRPTSDQIITLAGIRLRIDPADMGLTKIMLLDREYEPMETELVRKSLVRGDTFIDVGANIGYYTLIASQIVGTEGRIFAFEPEPHNFARLQQNVDLNRASNVIPVPFAVSDRSGSVSLYVPKGQPGQSQLLQFDQNESEMRVNAIALDDYFRQFDSNSKISLIKMDIEGAEVLALRGMKALVRSNPTVRLIAEVFPEKMKNLGGSADEFLAELRELGFRCLLIDEVKRSVDVVDHSEILRYALKHAYANIFCERA